MRYAWVLLLIVVLVFPMAAEAGRFRSYRWPADDVIVVENRMGREWNQAVRYTVSAWHRVFPKLKYRVIHRPGRRCAPKPGRIIICAVSFRTQWAGLTSVGWQGHKINSGLVRVSRTPKGTKWRGKITLYDLQTLCHEFGHALGLTHNPHPEQSCVANGSTRTTPGSYDRNSLRLLYQRNGKNWP
jgi:hypothetical protein